jgi:alkanesulfonate monooxygenase SsuD/methylene tetrahydromethanopterin reductase-like flavin-dependent oxidoreductase (luciferase family)
MAVAVTSRLTVGTGSKPIPLRNVALTAMELATMSRLFPGRLMAGVGHGVLDWMGQVGARAESPLTLLREYTTALYALLHGRTVTTRGRYVSLADVTLDWPPAVPPTLLVGGVKPRTVALAGELSDGVIISSGPSPEEVRVSAGHFRENRPDGAGEVAAGATHVAVNAAGEDVDLEGFVRFLAAEVSPRLLGSAE